MLLFLRGLLDRLFLVGAVTAGGLLPGYIAQYRQRLGGRLEQARMDLQPWQDIADRFYQGDIHRLIQYHLESRDPVFHAEGSAIQSLTLAVQRLQAAVDALHTGLLQQLRYLSLHGDPALARATFTDWVPTFALSLEGVVFALSFAIVVWGLFHAIWQGGAFAGRRLRRIRPRIRPSSGAKSFQ